MPGRAAVALQARFQARPRDTAQLLRLGRFCSVVTIGTPGGKARQDRRVGARAKYAALRDLDRGRQRLRQVGKQRRYFGAGLEAMLRRQLPAIGIGDQLAFGDAKQRIMRLIIVAAREEWLVRRHERQPPRISKLDQARVPNAPPPPALTVQFHVENVIQHFLQSLATPQRYGILSGNDHAIERSTGSPRKGKKSLVGFAKPRDFDMRRLLRSRLEISARAYPHQRAVAVLIGGEQNQPRKSLLDTGTPRFYIP